MTNSTSRFRLAAGLALIAGTVALAGCGGTPAPYSSTTTTERSMTTTPVQQPTTITTTTTHDDSQLRQ